MTELRSVMLENFQERLFCKERGCFADARIDDALSEMHSEHASMAAIRFGLADEAATASVIRRFYETPYEPGNLPYTAECEPFFTVFVLQALDRAGRFDLALQLIRDRWGRRMLDKGARSTYEEWSCNGSWRSGEWAPIMRTHSHAWSAAPAEFLVRNLIGLEILEPGGKRCRVNPQETSFPYKVVCPLKEGEVTVDWDGAQMAVSESGVELVR